MSADPQIPVILDPFNLDLEQATLIEASAGTGKTYTITTLVARLVAQGYPIESILVVTFTEAAAAELKLRIRARLVSCLDPESTEDELTAFFARSDDARVIRRRLALAVTCFDQASVMTIHSFCHSVLRENAFESSAYFNMELLLDSRQFLNQTIMDFFGARISNQDPVFLAFLTRAGFTPETLGESLGRAALGPGIRRVPKSAEFTEVGDDYRQLIQDLTRVLTREREQILQLLSEHKGLDKRSYSKRNLPSWLDKSLETLTRTHGPVFFEMTEKGDPLFKFTPQRLAEKTKSGLPPEHGFFDLCGEMLEIHQRLEQNLIRIKLDFLDFFAQSLEQMKAGEAACFFDDLINDLWAALETGGDRGLRTAVRNRYRACLIDEFQDTDPVQYRIFARLFGQGSGGPTPFFMIGDPKQAIYAFRGGDIFAYMAAATTAGQAFTLGTNYRSAPALVRAVNHIFSLIPSPFGFTAIPFIPVTTPKGAADPLGDGEKGMAPLQFSFIHRQELGPDQKGRITKASANQEIPRILARDILALLTQNQLTLENRPVTPEDMAVLVRTNGQAQTVYEALSDLGIPSYVSKTGSVFDTVQAMEFHDILSAVNAPGNTAFLKAALSTSLLYTPPEILAKDDEGVSLWQDRFFSLYQIWETRGFVSMINTLFHKGEGGIYPGTACSERALTNFYHLVELLSQAALNQSLARPYLLKWYEKQLVPETRESGEDELRLESDDQAVAIVTIHKSKGLEYPFVFLPYLWDFKKSQGAKGAVLFHDPDAGHQLTLDLGSPFMDRAREFAAREDEAEQMRLLYVALTRASAMCRIYWAGVPGYEKTALARLIHPGGSGDDPAMLKDIQELVKAVPESISQVAPCVDEDLPLYSPAREQAGELSPRLFSGPVLPEFKITSYSGLVSGRHSTPPLQSPPLDSGTGEERILLEDFPKGAGAGDFFHDLLEDMDFTDPDSVHGLAPPLLDKYGFSREKFLEMAAAAVKDILATPLSAGSTREFCLEAIEPSKAFAELEFCFDTGLWDMDALAELLETDPATRGYAQRFRQIRVPSVTSFIKGFIDLVVCHNGRWYILDYKSNFLGPLYSDYNETALCSAMAEHDYLLQYLLYLVALDRYLGMRLREYRYEEHMGGIFYLFLRGMKPGQKTGVYYHSPSPEFMARLKALV